MPQSVTEWFKIKENQVHQLRSDNINFSLGEIKFRHIKFHEKEYCHSAASLGNSLPNSAKEQNSLSKFKSIPDAYNDVFL